MNRKPNDTLISDRLRSLVHRSFDEAMAEPEVREIEQALESSAEIRCWYAQVAQLHADLTSHAEAREICKQIRDEFSSDASSSEVSPPMRMPTHRRWGWSPVSIAASLLVVGLGTGCGLGLLAATIIQLRPSFEPASWTWNVDDDVVAKVVNTDNAIWQASESPKTLPTLGLRSSQQIRLDGGKMQLSFRTGVNLVLQGPVVFEIRSQDAGKLYSGHLTATVPPDIEGFFVETSTGTAQLGPGHFGVEVTHQQLAHICTFHAFTGAVPHATSAQFVSNSGERHSIADGEALRFDSRTGAQSVPLGPIARFETHLPKYPPEPFVGDTIFLGNLFDDSKNVPLSEAMITDTYQAAGETINLGVAAVHDGGLDVDIRVAEDGVMFNFANVGGGGPEVLGLPGNDTYRSISPIPIRTTGEDFNSVGPLPKEEEGIGMCSNELITFDLEELREAGQLGNRTMRLKVDRAGINDREDPLLSSRNDAHARSIVLVSTEDEILSGHVDGRPIPVIKHGDVFLFDPSIGPGPALRYDGQFVTFDVLIPPSARYLTLAVTMLRTEHHDHVVFSGARLELSPPEAPDDSIANTPND